MFAAGGADCIVRVYDEQSRGLIANLEGRGGKEPGYSNRIPGHTNRIFSIKFIQDNCNLLLSAGWDMNIMFWDIR